MTSRRPRPIKRIRFRPHPPRGPGPVKPFFEQVSEEEAIIWVHEGQTRALESRRPKILLTAGTQSGKTIFGPWWLYREIFGEKDENGTVIWPGTARDGEENDYLAVTASYPLFKNKLLPSLTKCFVTITGSGRYHASDRVIELKNPRTGRYEYKKPGDPMWGRIILGSASAGSGTRDEGVRQLESATVRASLADEVGLSDFTETAWEALERRGHHHHARILAMTTLYNFGWLRPKLYIPWTQGDTSVDIIQFDSLANPAFPEDEYLRMQARLPPWKFDMLYRGIFTRPSGQIFESFDQAVHVVNPFPIPNTWPVICGIDPGPVNTALVWLARDPGRNIAYIWHESLGGGLTSAEHASRARQVAGHYKVTYYGGSTSEKQFRMDWQRERVPVLEPLVADVEQGLDRIIALFKTGRLFVFRSCPRIIDQLTEYARILDSQGQSTEKIQDKHKYHLIDALRYGLPGFRLGGQQFAVKDLYREKSQIPGLGPEKTLPLNVQRGIPSL